MMKSLSRHSTFCRASGHGLRTFDRGRRDGSLIIIAVWAVFFLALLAVAIGVHVSTNLDVASRVKQRLVAGELAKGALAHASMLITSNTNEWDGLEEQWSEGSGELRSILMEGGYGSVWHTNVSDNGVTTTNYGLIDEERRINISRPFNNGPVLRSLLVIVGGLDGTTATEVSNAMMDWKDADDDAREGGAEEPYYSSQDPPYECHNYIFDTLEELLLVKGVDEALYRRLRDSITVYGSGRVNINTAGRESLEVLVHATGATVPQAVEIADKILDYRGQGLLFSAGGSIEEMRTEILDSLHKMVGLTGEEQEILSKVINAGQLGIQSTEFRGWASGRVTGRPVDDRTIEFVIHGQDGRVLYWRGN